MRALRNVLADLVFQFKLRGALAARLGVVVVYYARYAAGRLAGRSREDSRMAALCCLAKRGFNYRVVTVGWPPGMRMSCDVFSAAFMVREFVEQPMYESVPGFAAQPGWTVVDVGAHQGCFTLLSASRVGSSGRVVSIEASPDNFRLLRGNIEANRLGHVTAVERAVSDREGQASFFVFHDVTVSGGSLVIEPEGAGAIKVAVEPLDAILARLGVGRPDLVKIDVEGAALLVLRGAERTLAARPRLVIEVEGEDSKVEEVGSYLKIRGYRTQRFGAIIYGEPGGPGA